MWMLNNRTPYAAERTWTRDGQGTHHWLVAIKATFDIAPDGRLSLADEQIPPTLAPEYRGDPATTSLRLDSDLLAPKPGTDILLDALAHAPRGRPAATVPVSLRVDDLEKTLIVHGTRVYQRGVSGITTSSPAKFMTQPIHYEWAFGGSDTSDPDPRRHRIDARNPVGKGFAADGGRFEDQPAHTVEYPDGNPAKVGPAGFGPIASFWSPRLERAGSYDERWEKSRKPLLAEDYDASFALSAPDDQRLPRPLRGGETVALTNMTPEGTLQFDLPKIFLAFETDIAGRTEDHRAIMTTVFVAPEQMQLSLVWQTTLRVVSRQVDYLNHTTIDEKRQIR